MQCRCRFVDIVDSIDHIVIVCCDRRAIEGVGFEYITTRIDVFIMNARDDIWSRQTEKIIKTLQILMVIF